MEIFGIGPLELLLIVLIALIVLGPKEMKKTAQKTAGWIKKLRQSELWSTTKEVMDIPNQVMHETGLDKEIHELQSLSKKSVADSLWQPTPINLNSQTEETAKDVKENNTAPEQTGDSKPAIEADSSSQPSQDANK